MMLKQCYANKAKLFVLFLIVMSTLSCRTTESASEEKAVFDANGQKIPDPKAGGAGTAWRALDKNTDGITGVGVLNATIVFTNQDICTAFLVDSGNDDGPAYVQTNSHCTFFKHWGFDRLKANEHRVDQPVSSHYVMFNHFVDVPAKQRISFKLKKVTYMTEYGTDVALLEVNATLKTLKDQGIVPLKLSATRPLAGDAVRLIGVPLFHVS